MNSVWLRLLGLNILSFLGPCLIVRSLKVDRNINSLVNFLIIYSLKQSSFTDLPAINVKR